MASELRVNQITSQTGLGTVTFDAAGGVTFAASPLFSATGSIGIGTAIPRSRFHIYSPDTRPFEVWAGTAGTAFGVDSSGRVLTPFQPAFFAYPNTNASLGGAQTYIFSLTQFNIGSHYSTSTGRFTAPVAGVYHFSYGVQHNASVNDNNYVDLHVNGSQYSSVVRSELFSSTTFYVVSASATIYLNPNDYVTLASAGTGWGDNSWFSGHLVG